jgi:hypothetical protein
MTTRAGEAAFFLLEAAHLALLVNGQTHLTAQYFSRQWRTRITMREADLFGQVLLLRTTESAARPLFARLLDGLLVLANLNQPAKDQIHGRLGDHTAMVASDH